PQRSEDLVGRIIVAPRRLARPLRRHRYRLARGARRRRTRQRKRGTAMNRLDGKVALISGAARGIGAETARLMIEAGAKVATGVFLGTKLALPALRESAQRSPQGSAIVNLSSVAGLVGSSGDPLYSMTKGGVTLFTKSSALEFARKGYRVRVNSIHPGTTETEMGDQVLVMRARNLGTNDIDEARRQALARLPIGRMGTVSDIAKGIVFLASDDAGFMTGSSLVVDGGITAQ